MLTVVKYTTEYQMFMNCFNGVTQMFHKRKKKHIRRMGNSSIISIFRQLFSYRLDTVVWLLIIALYTNTLQKACNFLIIGQNFSEKIIDSYKNITQPISFEFYYSINVLKLYSFWYLRSIINSYERKWNRSLAYSVTCYIVRNCSDWQICATDWR